jgi:uncharacterized repeat protein (TIGR03803 family)
MAVVVKTLVNFNGINGSHLQSGLIADANGDLFGTTFDGGANNDGTVFEIAKTASCYATTPTILLSFDGTNGASPDGSLIADTNGDLFGTTNAGGANNFGTVFEITRTVSGYATTPTILLSFAGTNGASPNDTLIADANGDLFGTTNAGGTNNFGTVFEITRTASGYATAPTTLLNFDGTNGQYPASSLIADADGDLFGTTNAGGTNNLGTAFEITGSGFVPFVPVVAISSTGGLTNHTSHTLSGTIDTADTNLTVSIYDGSTLIGTAMPLANGNWSASVSLLSAQGAQQITAQATDAAGNVGTSNPINYTLDTIAPQLQGFTASGPLLTNANVVHYTLTFSEPVNGVNASDFSLNASGVTGANIASVDPVLGSNGTQYSVTVSTGLGDGTIALNLVEAGIHDLAGNSLPSGTFQSQTVSAPGNATFVAIGDVNGDGKPDLVTTDYYSGTVSVFLGNGNGTFQPPSNYSTGSGPESLAIGDVNGDGKPDLVVANFGLNAGIDPLGTNTVSVLLGNGNGTFQPQTSYATGNYPLSVAMGDLNGDGKTDLVVANSDSNTVSVLLGNGNGTFQTQTSYATAANPSSVAIGDLNGDGKLDLVTANFTSGTVSVLLGNGDGTFRAQTNYATGINSSPDSVAIGDVNGDGIPDLAVANVNSNTISVLLGDGDGTFQTQTSYATGNYPSSVAMGDVNGDGKPDLVISNFNSGTVSVLLGNGNGTFQSQATYVAGNNSNSVATADLNRDGSQDIVTANFGPNMLTVLLGSPPVVTSSAYTIDRTPPSPATITSVIDNVAPVTGTLTSGSSTNDPDPSLRVSLSGTGALAGDAVQLYNGTNTISPLGSSYTLTSTDINNGFANLQTGTLTNGTTYTLTARFTDAAGNQSGVSSNSFTVSEDTTAPTVAITTIEGGDNLINVAEAAGGIQISGMAEIGSTLTVNRLAVTVDGTGHWTTSVTPTNQGTLVATAVATDAAGNSSIASTTLTVDTIAPTVTIANPSGTTNQTALTVTGTGEIGTTVTLFDTVNGVATVLGSAIVNSGGAWTTTASLVNGNNSLTATDTDAAGNKGTSTPVILNLSTTAPPLSGRLANDTGSSSSDKITSNDALTGIGLANTAVHFTIDGSPIVTSVTADAQGAWSFTPSGLTDGTHTIVASQTDSIGNTGTATTSFALDTTAPVVTESLRYDINGNAAVSGTGDANALVHFTLDGAAIATIVTANGNGTWTFTPAGLPLGSHTIVASETDTAGNTGTSNVITFTHIAHAPGPGGTASNDIFLAGGDDKSFDGIAGHDTLLFDGNSAQYNIATHSDGSIVVTDSVAGRDGINQIVRIESLQFTDKTIFVENADNANIARLYSAALDRPPDFNGLSGWEDIFTTNISAAVKAHGVYAALAQTDDGFGTSIAGGFTQSVEFQSKYGNLNDADFVSRLYLNVLNRTPALTELNAWLGLIQNGDANGTHYTHDMVLVGFAESPENIAKTAGWLIQV